MDRNRWLVFGLLCVAVIAGLVMLSGKDKIDVSSRDATAIDTTSPIPDHVFGTNTAKIIVIEYADFQCAGCGGAYPQLKAIKNEYNDHIAFVFRNFPLTSGHAHAFAAAASAEAAGLQGKYWEMHDVLFEGIRSWSGLTAEQRTTVFEGYATQIGLNIEQFRQDLSSEKVATKINTDRALGIKVRVDTTPTIFLNGQKLDESTVDNIMQSNGDALRDKLDDLIKQAGGTPPIRATTAQ